MVILSGGPLKLLEIQLKLGIDVEVDLGLVQTVSAVHHGRFLLVLNASELLVSTLKITVITIGCIKVI